VPVPFFPALPVPVPVAQPIRAPVAPPVAAPVVLPVPVPVTAPIPAPVPQQINYNFVPSSWGNLVPAAAAAPVVSNTAPVAGNPPVNYNWLPSSWNSKVAPSPVNDARAVPLSDAEADSGTNTLSILVAAFGSLLLTLIHLDL